MADAAQLAVEEINESGGINGRKIVPVIEDAASDPAQTATKARKLVMQDQVAAIVGGLTSSLRQAMLPIVEENKSVLIYPGTFEGEEYSENIIYTGSVPNQQLTPLIPWLTENVGKKVFLIGNDYVYPAGLSLFQMAHLLPLWKGDQSDSGK
jgi:ABC-type branched-subunit amino acid transport system substrate-binding protein